MRTLILIALSGIIAQLVDGALGMGFGVTSTSLMLLLAGLGPAQASAVVHTAELGTTLASGASHWKFGNVDWKTALRLGIPGAIGAFVGSTLLGNISLKAAQPLMATILCCIGLSLLWRFSRGRGRSNSASSDLGRKHMSVLGLFGGVIDASGGGGWGPVTSSTLMAYGRTEPRRVVGTVDAAEFLVTLAATLGFVLSLWEDLRTQFALVLALLIGGVLAAPLGAWLTSRLNPTVLGGLVGTTLIATNVTKVLPFGWLVPVVIVVGLAVSLYGWKRSRAASVVAVVSEDPPPRDAEAEVVESAVR